jgi:hypothetical protein
VTIIVYDYFRNGSPYKFRFGIRHCWQARGLVYVRNGRVGSRHQKQKKLDLTGGVGETMGLLGFAWSTHEMGEKGIFGLLG